jgi:hypothetical protein
MFDEGTGVHGNTHFPSRPSTIFSTSMSVGNSTIPDYRWHIEDAPAPRLMRNRVIANNPRPPKSYAAITRKAGGT